MPVGVQHADDECDWTGWTPREQAVILRSMSDRNTRRCTLALEDGTFLFGAGFGAGGTRLGEVVFNTSMTGYQEILTDPSYHSQIVTMTFPQIGNYGINSEDVESARPQVSGFVVRELARRVSNYRATQSLEDYLLDHNVVGIQGVDTRALAKKLRVDGAMRGVITTEIDDPAECVRRAREAPSMTGADLVRHVAPRDVSTWEEGLNTAFMPSHGASAQPRTIVAIDCGMKRNILRHLVDMGCQVHVAPPTLSADQVLGYKPDGVLVSNGPGDPAAVHSAIDLLKGLLGKVPLFGICLGHQLLGRALGARTFKLKFGHRGANQPVQNLSTGRVEITSQNHGFAIDTGTLARAGGTATHVNLNDKTLEGFIHKDMLILAVQYHPEASPGPHDATYLFDCFDAMLSSGRAPTADEMSHAQTSLQHRKATVRPSSR